MLQPMFLRLSLRSSLRSFLRPCLRLRAVALRAGIAVGCVSLVGVSSPGLLPCAQAKKQKHDQARTDDASAGDSSAPVNGGNQWTPEESQLLYGSAQQNDAGVNWENSAAKSWGTPPLRSSAAKRVSGGGLNASMLQGSAEKTELSGNAGSTLLQGSSWSSSNPMLPGSAWSSAGPLRRGKATAGSGSFLQGKADSSMFPLSTNKRFARGLTPMSALAGVAEPIAGKEKKVLYKGFLKMNCLEFNELGANYYTADKNYRGVGIKYGISGRTSGAIEGDTTVSYGGRDHTIHMAMPGFRGGQVFLYSNDQHLIAIDPRTYDAWVWEPKSTFSDLGGTWKKLTHRKPKTH